MIKNKIGLYFFVAFYSIFFFIWYNYMIQKYLFHNSLIIAELIILGFFGFFYNDIYLRTGISSRYVNIFFIIISTILIIYDISYTEYIITSLIIIHMMLIRNIYNIWFNKSPIFRYKKSDKELKLKKLKKSNNDIRKYENSFQYYDRYYLKGFFDDIILLTNILWSLKNNRKMFLYCDSLIKHARGGIYKEILEYSNINGTKNWFNNDNFGAINMIFVEINEYNILYFILNNLWLGEKRCKILMTNSDFYKSLNCMKLGISNINESYIIFKDEELYVAEIITNIDIYNILNESEINNKIIYTEN